MDSGLNPTTAPLVSITFRISENMHALLMVECSQCGCTVSALARSAIVREIADRVNRRRLAAQHAALVFSSSLGE